MSRADATLDPAVRSALDRAVDLLRRLAAYELEPGIDRRMLDLGERKEFLNEEEHAELDALVEFWRKRNLEKAEAGVILKDLSESLPELVDGS